ncbi:hypothetical protein LCGC14_2019780, partial [marine sediment metagenome]
AGAVQWLAGDTLVGKGAKSLADFFEENAAFIAPEDPTIVADVAGGFGSMFTLLLPGAAVSKGLRSAQFISRGVAAFLQVGIFTVNESLVEAGSVYRERIAQTGSREDAEGAARFVFFLNLPLNALTNKLGLFAGKSQALRSVITEGTQEAAQSVVSQIPTRERIDFAQVRHEALIGAIVGGGTGAIMQRASRTIEAVPGLSPQAQQVYSEAEQAALDEGATAEAADIAGTQALGATEEGQAYIEATADAMDVVLEAEAAIAKLAEGGAILPTIEITEEEVNALFDSGATQEEIVATLIRDIEEIPVDTAEADAALAELQASQQEAAAEARVAQLEQKAVEIEADAIATFQALEEGVDPLPQLESLGNIAFDEGATTIETFTERMKAKLGELWERFKGFIQAVFDKLREERGAIEFGEPTQEQRIAELRTQIQEQVKLARIARREGRSEAVEAARRRINRIRSREAQARVKVRVERATRRTLTELASETLPVALRGKFLKAIANATTPTQFGDVAIRIQSAANAFTEAQELKKNLGSKRGKIAFIRKINEINQTVINDIKKELNISKPLRLMNEKELEAVTEKLKARVRFKRSRGFRPKIEDRGSKRTDIPEALYEVRRNLQPSKKEQFKQKIKKFREESTPEKLLGIISTRLANIDESLRQTLRKFEFNLGRSVRNDLKVATPFIKKVQKMTPDDYTDFGWALKNGDVNTINPLLEKYDMADEFAAVR